MQYKILDPWGFWGTLFIMKSNKTAHKTECNRNENRSSVWKCHQPPTYNANLCAHSPYSPPPSRTPSNTWLIGPNVCSGQCPVGAHLLHSLHTLTIALPSFTSFSKFSAADCCWLAAKRCGGLVSGVIDASPSDCTLRATPSPKARALSKGLHARTRVETQHTPNACPFAAGTELVFHSQRLIGQTHTEGMGSTERERDR